MSLTDRRRDGRDRSATATDTELLSTLFELGREVTSVLDLDELLHKIPQLIARLTQFSAFAVYLLDEKRQELRIAYAVGYPEDVARRSGCKVGQGVVGAAVAGRAADPRQRRPPGSALHRGRCANMRRSWPCRCAARAASSAR